MRINRQGVPDNQLERTQGRQTERVGSRASESHGSNKFQFGLDRVEVSNLADTADQIVSQTGHARAARVAHLTALRESGQLNVDSTKLADSIIDHDSEIVAGEQ